MKAIIQDHHGSADVLELRDVAAPVVGDNDILVRVHAAVSHVGSSPGAAAGPALDRPPA
jgi:hypothetical protein